MGLIKLQCRPKIPPIGFFQPISTDPRDMMTDVEYLLGILKKLNETIKQVNSNTSFIEDYDGRIEAVESEIAALRSEMTTFETNINNTITTRFNEIRTELQSMIATALIQANAYTDTTAAILRQEIQEIALGQIKVYDPTTGIINNLQATIDNLYGASRVNALTASEYDGLELMATDYDGRELTAVQYDREGKTLLVTP